MKKKLLQKEKRPLRGRQGGSGLRTTMEGCTGSDPEHSGPAQGCGRYMMSGIHTHREIGKAGTAVLL